MMWYGWNVMPMMVFGLVVLGLLAAGVVALARFAVRTPDRSAEPERLLALRFARGEIDEQEYRARLAALRDRDTAAW
jgi:putative membrane protein